MAKYTVSFTTITPTATADTTNLVDNTYFATFQGGTATQRLRFYEFFLGGQAGSTSSPTYWLFSRDSTVGTGTNSAGSGQMASLTDASATAPVTAPLLGNQWATTKPQRSATAHLLNLSFNAYGGVVRWVASPDEDLSVIGNTASLGEASLSAFTGGTPGPCGGHVILEAT